MLKEIAEAIFSFFLLELVEVPIVHGFMYEFHYVRTMRNAKSMALRDVEIQIDAVEGSTEIQKLPAGILRHLRYTYLVIDAIGYLKVNGIYRLVYEQVLPSEYRYHRTKMPNLTSVKALEDNAQTIFQFCESLTKKRNNKALYVHVTPPDPETLEPQSKKGKDVISLWA